MRLRRPIVVLVLIALVALTSCDRVVRISIDAAGGDANGESGTLRGSRVRGGIAVDGTGRVVVFESAATDLLPGGNTSGLFLRDLTSGSTRRIATGITPDITPDGRYVTYTDLSTGTTRVVVLDRTTDTTEVVSVLPDGSPSPDPSSHPSISDDGRYVVWESASADLVPGFYGTNVFLRDRLLRSTRVVSVAVDGGPANETSHTPVISGDGRFVAFSSWASNMTVGDTPTGYREVFRRDLVAGVTEKVSVDDSGVPISFAALNPTISHDGRFVAFDGPGRVYVRDLTARQTEDLGRGQLPAISADGRMVAFVTSVGISPLDRNGRTDIYVRDRTLATTTQLSVTGNAQQRPGDSSDAVLLSPAITDDGHLAAFATESALVDADHNGLRDVYLRPAWRPTVSSVSPSALIRGTTASLVVRGDGFTATSDAGVDLPDTPGVHVTGVSVVSATELHAQVAVDADAPVGARTLLVTNRTAEPGNPTSTVGFCANCLTVS